MVFRILTILIYFILMTQLRGRVILSILIISRGRGPGKMLLPVTWKKEKRAKCLLCNGNNFCSQCFMWRILLGLHYRTVHFRDSRENEQSCTERLWCSRQMCLWCPWFLTGTITAGPSFFCNNKNTSPFLGLWSENAVGTVSGYWEHLIDVSPLSVS